MEVHTMAKRSMTDWQEADIIKWTLTELEDCPYMTTEAALKRILRKYSYDLPAKRFAELHTKFQAEHEKYRYFGLEIPAGS